MTRGQGIGGRSLVISAAAAVKPAGCGEEPTDAFPGGGFGPHPETGDLSGPSTWTLKV
jgi:hypothetical protein